MSHQKQCFKCEQVKPLDEFYQDGRMLDGFLNKCKQCTRLDVKKNRKKKLEQYKEYDRERAMRPNRVAARKEYAASERGKAIQRLAHKKSRERFPEKFKARYVLNNAIRDGKIVRPLMCRCGSTGRIEAHHIDYSKPLEVIWLCKPCHVKADKELGVRK